MENHELNEELDPEKVSSEELRAIGGMFAWFILFIAATLISAWKWNKEGFDIAFSTAACVSVMLIAVVVGLRKIPVKALWALVLLGGLLAVLYEYVHEYLFPLVKQTDGSLVQKTDFQPQRLLTEPAKLGVRVLQVAFITILSEFMIRTVAGIRTSTWRALQSSKQYERVMTSAERITADLHATAEGTDQALRSMASVTEIETETRRIEATDIQSVLRKGLAEYAHAWSTALLPYKPDVPKQQRKAVSALIKKYLEEEAHDIEVSKIATNFAMYATLVEEIINLASPPSPSDSVGGTPPVAPTPRSFLDAEESLVIFTVWDKDPKRWYNFDWNGELDKKKRAYWVSSRFEDYKRQVARIVKEAKEKETQLEFRRFILTSAVDGKAGIRSFISAKKNLNDHLFKFGGDVVPIDAQQVRSFLNATGNEFLRDELGLDWVNNIKGPVYFYIPVDIWTVLECENRLVAQNWIRLGEHFMKTYHSSPVEGREAAMVVELEEGFLSRYIDEKLARDFTLIGTRTRDKPERWICCIGVDSDPSREVLELEFSTPVAHEDRFKKYVDRWNTLDSSPKKYSVKTLLNM